MGISQISGGSRTSVGGYAETELPDHNSAQFDVSDTRTLDEVVNWVLELGYIPSFCTACYREGRTGDRFMEFCKSGQIQDFCQPNALLTLGEYLCDYASPAVAEKGWKMIDTELARVPDDRRRALAARMEEPLEDHSGLAAADHAERAAVRDGLRRVLEGLSREERRLFTLRFVYGLSSAELGGVLGLSPNGVDARVSRLRKKLKRLLARQGLGLWEREGTK